MYQAEIERSLINVILANQAAPEADPPGIRYFAHLETAKATPTNVVTCCESQGTRTYGALPEFVYSVFSNDSTTVHVNLFVPSKYHGDGFTLVQTTGFPSNGSVSLAMSSHDPETTMAAHVPSKVTMMLRVPSWCLAASVPVTVKDADGATVKTMVGVPGTFLAVELADAQMVEAHFPMSLRVSLYNGTVPMDPFRCNAKSVVRAAVEYGPVLLAATYANTPQCLRKLASQRSLIPSSGPNAPAVTIIGIDPVADSVASWLSLASKSSGGDPVFTVKGTDSCIVFRPYYSMQNETLSVYPNFLTRAGLDQRGQCGVTGESAHGASTISTVCMACPAGHRISAITDAQFGVLSGNCSTGKITALRCLANATLVKQVVSQYCTGAKGCSLPVAASLYGAGGSCPTGPGLQRSLAVTVECAADQCDMAVENWPHETASVVLACPAGQTIKTVLDAQYGVLAGNCSAGFHVSGCVANATQVLDVVRSRCVGKQNCTVPASRKLFPSTCGGNTLVATVACAK